MRWPLYFLGLLLAVTSVARADEIRLKDGSKITGIIVDFQDDAFKVQTAYGFAMVRKDSIAQIIPNEPVSTAAAAAPAAPATATATVVKPVAVSSPAVRVEAQPAVSKAAATVLPMPAPRPRAAAPVPVATVAPAASSVPAASLAPAAAPLPAVAAPVAAAAPAAPPPVAPGPIRESVQGTVYRNDSYNFQLYRPPGWDVMQEARKSLPNAITAMGTSDQGALLLVGRDAAKDSLETQAAAAERALQKVYENYRHISSSKRTVNGLPAVEWKFRGMADGHDWSVTALTIAHGTDVFTLLGMTYADSDMIMQIRENVLAKIIASLQFSAPR
jgi:hypothetical protein